MNKKVMIPIICICIILAIVIILVCVITNKKDVKENKTNISAGENNTNIEKEENNMYSSGKHHAEIQIVNYGTIKLELDADVAPITVANFAKLVNQGFYDGLKFHRIISGFMMQGGASETENDIKTIKGEFKANGVTNNISHKRGVISMARAQSYNSASSQFFIVHQDSTYLDGQYAAFGKVTEGIEVVDKVCESVTPIDDNGTILEEDQPVIQKITMLD